MCFSAFIINIGRNLEVQVTFAVESIKHNLNYLAFTIRNETLTCNGNDSFVSIIWRRSILQAKTL